MKPTLHPIKNLTLKNVQAVDALVRDHATYVHDHALRDTWTSYAKGVMAGEAFSGDCDDWASTSLDILAKLGWPKNRMWRALVSSTGEAIDHMIGLVELDDGKVYCVGDTFGPPCLVASDRVRDDKRNHKVIKTALVSERSRAPWKAFAAKPTKVRETNGAAMGMRTSAACQAFMKAHEAFIPVAYDDFRPRYVLKTGDVVKGTLTIGYGHTGDDVFIGQRITKVEGDRMFDEDIKLYERAVRKLVKRPVNQNQFDALVSFCFNCGETNLKTSTLLKLVNAGAEDHDVQEQFRRWTRSKGKVMAGLVKRRNAEAAMYAGEVVTHGGVVATARLPDIGCTATVKEDASVKGSRDIWGLGGALTAGGAGVWASVKEVIEEFRDTVYDVAPLVATIAGVAVAIIATILLVKRVREIMDARR